MFVRFLVQQTWSIREASIYFRLISELHGSQTRWFAPEFRLQSLLAVDIFALLGLHLDVVEGHTKEAGTMVFVDGSTCVRVIVVRKPLGDFDGVVKRGIDDVVLP